jgi:uncharacterized protein YkuJ
LLRIICRINQLQQTGKNLKIPRQSAAMTLLLSNQ